MGGIETSSARVLALRPVSVGGNNRLRVTGGEELVQTEEGVEAVRTDAAMGPAALLALLARVFGVGRRQSLVGSVMSLVEPGLLDDDN